MTKDAAQANSAPTQEPAAAPSPKRVVLWGAGLANLRFLADNLSPKKTESSRDTLRRYLCDNFFKDHLQTYKKRPIYWLFSSGKQGAFQALVYLHRYHEGTLARMRAEYVVPLTGKIQSRIEMLQKDAASASSTATLRAPALSRWKLVKHAHEQAHTSTSGSPSSPAWVRKALTADTKSMSSQQWIKRQLSDKWSEKRGPRAGARARRSS